MLEHQIIYIEEPGREGEKRFLWLKEGISIGSSASGAIANLAVLPGERGMLRDLTQTVGAAAGDAAAGVFSLLKAAAPTGAAPPSLVWNSDAGHGGAASERRGECGFREVEGRIYIGLGIQSQPPPPSRAAGGGWGLGVRTSGCY